MKTGTKLHERNKKPEGIFVAINKLMVQTQTTETCWAYYVHSLFWAVYLFIIIGALNGVWWSKNTTRNRKMMI